MLAIHSDKDRNKALREWVRKDGNIDAMEATLEMHRQESLKGERVWEQVSVKDMSKPPYNFSECLV